MYRICVDIMGSDKDPKLLCEGIDRALAARDDFTVLVAGTEEYVKDYCASNDRLEALISTEVIHMDEHPAEAVRTKKDSSIVQACLAVKEGRADAFFSPGSTGAIMASATLRIGRLKGVKRPALGAALPRLDRGSTIMLDLGANADVKPETLYQFAVMGKAYAEAEFALEHPRIALLSNGTEKSKGSDLIQKAHKLLEEKLSDFVGNCEASDILMGDYDLIVCDGFTGNVALKALEGTAKFILSRIKEATKQSKRATFGALALKPSLLSLRDDLSGDAHGGAVLLGLKAPVVIGHGDSSAEAVYNAILVCLNSLETNLCSRIEQDLLKFQELSKND